MSSGSEPQRLRVLIVAHNAVGGSNRARVDALARMPDLDVRLVTPPWWGEEGRWVDAREEHEEPRPYRWEIGRVAACGNGTRYWYRDTLPRLVRNWRPHVIDVYEEPFSLAAFQCELLRRAFRREAALVFYSAVNVQRRWRLPYRLTEQVVLHAADGSYAPSREVGPLLRERGLRCQCWTIPLGVDEQRFASQADETVHPFLAGIPGPRIGFVGRIEPVKGLDVLLDAARRSALDGTFVIAGDGSDKERLKGRTREMGLGERVRYLPPVAFSGLPRFLRGLDVLVLPSVTLLPLHREQFGRVLVEAMAAGTPVVGSDSGAIPEVIGNAGLVVPEGDAVALGEAIRRVIGDKSLARELSERGIKRASEYYAWPAIARLTRVMYWAAVEHRRRDAGGS